VNKINNDSPSLNAQVNDFLNSTSYGSSDVRTGETNIGNRNEDNAVVIATGLEFTPDSTACTPLDACADDPVPSLPVVVSRDCTADGIANHQQVLSIGIGIWEVRTRELWSRRQKCCG